MQLQLSVLLKDTSTMVAAEIQIHILTTQPSEHKSDALYLLAMTSHCQPNSLWIVQYQMQHESNSSLKPYMD